MSTARPDLKGRAAGRTGKVSSYPPGFDGKLLFGILIFGAPLSLIWAASEYRRHLNT